MSNPLISALFTRLLDKRLKDVSENKYKELKSMIPELFGVQSSDSAFDEYYDIGAMPDIPEFNGKLAYNGQSPGYYNKIETKEYAGGTTFERKLLDDKKYGVFDSRAEALMTAAHRTREKIAARQYAGAFSAAFDFQQSEEGVSLCSTAHTTKAGVSTANGFSNSGTSALSKTAVAATRILMRKFRSDIGERIEIEPDILLVPDNLYDTALEIVGTPKGLYSGEGTVNTQYERFKVIPYMRLDDYSTTRWYMLDSNLMKKNMRFIDRIAPEVKNTIDFETFSVKHSIYFRCGAGFLGWRHIFGQNA